ncbi:hypothetical protein SLEP1_g54495 [Rubroshorea leprosula]|uniref:Uncharacterized protein n=1 Tax=Rubroshorea leprosula TaxID=152421 RepID=A0AAV5MDJ0_9ROSI|nr:hypothetical protein SLEP1_g54495 [Rubroshorea leprosula]
MEVVGGAFMSAAFELLLSKLSSSVSEWLNLPEEVCVELQNLRNLLPKIDALLEDAEDKQGRGPSVKLWLADLKDLFYDVEDILEEVDIDAKRFERFAEPQASTSKRQKLIFPKLFNKDGRFTAEGERKMASRVEEITARWRRIEANIRSLNEVSLALRTGDESHEVTTERLPSTPLLEQHVYGRENDKEDILQILLNDEGNHEPYSVIPIVGMGGIGKTTLARLIYNDDKLKGRFGLQAWVCVSDDFDVYRITRAILEQVPTANCDKKELTPLQEKLQDELSGKKFLLVLDDIWNEDYGLWENLQRPFLKGAPGSRIIITTRSENIGRMIRGDGRVHNLSLLEDDACLSLFAQISLGAENFDEYPDLKRVGEKIVEKCKRLPLAIKSLSGLLRGKADLAEWENILNSEIWDLPVGNTSILPALKLSYNHLPSHLKRCFGYCSMFPKDYEFDEGELVLLWMAEGFLQQQPLTMKKMKAPGHQSFRELLSRAFFQRSSWNESSFVMHDLMVDLALHVAGDICYTLESDGDISNMRFQRVRHLLLFPVEYLVSKRFEFLKKKKNLRTFLPLQQLGFEKVWLSNTLLQDLMKDLKCLRVLSLQNYKITELSDQIGDLKHLRFIDLSWTGIESLPESVGYLIYLQTLLLRGCRWFSNLPTTIGNLLDLQHLDLVTTPSLKEFPSEISKLTRLVTLSKFIVGDARGPRVKDLKNLSGLQGQLSILDLQNVVAANEAKEVNLFEIEGLDHLSLEWSSDFLNNRNERSELQVLSLLKPYHGLKRLTINYFGGLEFPSWIGDPSFSNLEFLKLNNCQKSTSLTSLQRLPRLKSLIIEGIHAIQTMMLDEENSSSVSAFPSLESLNLRDCPILKGKFPKCIPVLKRLVIARCPKLIYSPISLPSLEELGVTGCSEAVLRSMVDLNSLKTLRISRISKLIWLPKSFVESLIALEVMEIESCDELTCLWEEGANMVNLAFLKRMQISRCPLLVSLTGKKQGFLPNSVQTLHIDDCEALEFLPIEIMMMVRLEYLYIRRCPALRIFPRGKLPTTLKIVEITECEKLESLPEGILMNNGDACQVSYLEELRIDKCPCLKSFPTGHLPNSFKRLYVRDCKQLEFIPQRMLQYYRELEDIQLYGNELGESDWSKYKRGYIHNCSGIDKLDGLDGLESLCPFIPNLKMLTIKSFKNLKSLPDKLQDLNSLDELCIINCPGIESIPDGGLPSNLKCLRIFDCPGIESIPDSGFPLNLRNLSISGCKNLKSLPDKLQVLNSLDELCITDCPGIESISDGGLPPNLTSLQICKCPGIEHISEGGLPPNLTSLKIRHCPRIESIPCCGSAPNLGELIIDCENMKKPMQEWGLSSITLLLTFEICWICPPDNVLPTSLTSLTVCNVENMKSISRGLLQNLNSLQHLEIRDCPKLQTLSKEALPASLQELIIGNCDNFRSLPKEGLPPLLERLEIINCPLLQRRCMEEEGDYWPLIAYIPEVDVLDW